MKQKEYFGENSIHNLKKIINIENPKKIFLVCGKKSFPESGAEEKLRNILPPNKTVRFSNFQSNPKIEYIKDGLGIYKEAKCDMLIAVGGGTSIDIAKSIKFFLINKENSHEAITKPVLVAMPTTAGSGSESTSFSVVYYGKKKVSLEHPSLLPNYSIIDYSLSRGYTGYPAACVGMDALSQGIESFWSIRSTKISKKYSKQAIKKILKNLEDSINSPNRKNKEMMAIGANLAGKGINIAKTTACHALSYPLTSYLNLPHGHAVSVFLGKTIILNSKVNEFNINDPRGVNYVRNTMEELYNISNTNNSDELKNKINDIMDGINLERSLTKLGLDSSKALFISKNINMERLGNNPTKMSKTDIMNLLT